MRLHQTGYIGNTEEHIQLLMETAGLTIEQAGLFFKIYNRRVLGMYLGPRDNLHVTLGIPKEKLDDAIVALDDMGLIGTCDGEIVMPLIEETDEDSD